MKKLGSFNRIEGADNGWISIAIHLCIWGMIAAFIVIELLDVSVF